MDSGAKAAISGFRLQALYTLDLILQGADSAKEFHPEGKEDLAVYENGSLIRAIQVKAYSAPLRLSDLAPRKEDSLLRRLISSGDSTSVFELASFGPLGPELEAVQRGEAEVLTKFSAKLREYGYSAAEIAEIVGRLQIVRVDEAAARDRVYRFFAQTMAAGDPDRAFDLLVWWILRAAENRRRIAFRDLREQLLLVGRFLAERKAHHDEWFTTIKPLEERTDSLATAHEKLAEEYYRGTAARYSHICADLDVRRGEPLEAIEGGFLENRKVVIIHGASGQGKTSLAMRYLHDYVPADWRFMVTAIDDRLHAAKIANALADHLRAIDALVWLFIDVAPRDLQWVALLRDLLDIENVRILIAIREEDLARRLASERELGFPADIQLDFTEHDAANIYAKLIARGDAFNAFPTFGEAWERFGGEGPLLEFVYLITQTESLRSVLASQVQRLREEVRSLFIEPAALRFLHICARATSFEARVKLAPLARQLKLRDPAGTVALFENEFLLRISTDRTKVEALHPVRSRLLAEELQDAAFAVDEEIALEALAYIPENDLEVYLLYLLSRIPGCWGRLREAISNLEAKTWTGAAGIGRALVWWGIKSYLTENRPTIEEARRIGGDVWGMLIIPDVAGALDTDLSEEMLELLRKNNADQAEELRRVRSNLTPQSRVFLPLRDWIKNLRMNVIPLDLSDWEGLAEMSFWAAHLGLSSPMRLNPADFPVASLPIRILAQICLALAEGDPITEPEFLRFRGDELKLRFRKEADVLGLREDQESVAADFLVPFDFLSSARRKENSNDSSDHTSVFAGKADNDQQGEFGLNGALNDEAVRRVEILRALFPLKELYCTQGLGHQLSFGGIEVSGDPTVKRMAPRALPIAWLVRVNTTLNNLEIYRHRPPTWRQFAKLLLEARETIASTLLRLHRALVSYFEGDRARIVFGDTLSVQLWERASELASADYYLPVSAVDEWGLSSETQSTGVVKGSEFSVSIASAFSRRNNRPLLKAIRSYMRSISNFLRQAGIICNVHGLVGRNAQTREQIVALASRQYGYDDEKLRLSKENLFQAMLDLDEMQRAFEERTGSLVDSRKLTQVSRRERSVFPELWALWYQFCHFPEKRLPAAAIRSLAAMEDSLDASRGALKGGIGSEMWKAMMVSEKFLWRGRPSLVLKLYIEAIGNLEIARLGILARLAEFFRNAEFGSLMRYALKYFWPHILIIPTLRGLALEAGSWVIPVSIFPGDSNGQMLDKPWLRFLHPLSAEQAQELGLDASSGIEGKSFKELIAKLVNLRLHFSHLALIARRAPDLDDVGRGILEKYLEKASRQLTEAFVGVHDLIVEVLLRIRQGKLGKQKEVDEVIEPIERLKEELERGSESFVLGECEAKAEQFEKLAILVTTLHWIMLPSGA